MTTPKLIIRLSSEVYYGELTTPNGLLSYSQANRSTATRFDTVKDCMRTIDENRLHGAMIEMVSEVAP
jgi:hypothetical protein